jgi:hypothetical protein
VKKLAASSTGNGKYLQLAVSNGYTGDAPMTKAPPTLTKSRQPHSSSVEKVGLGLAAFNCRRAFGWSMAPRRGAAETEKLCSELGRVK